MLTRRGRRAAEGKAGGPQFTSGKGPTNRRDMVIALLAIAFVIGPGVLIATIG